jgi:hypothetical protein
VRELENAIKGEVVITKGPVIRPEARPLTVDQQLADLGPSSGAIDLNRPLMEVAGEIVAGIGAQRIHSALGAPPRKRLEVRQAQQPVAPLRDGEAPATRAEPRRCPAGQRQARGVSKKNRFRQPGTALLRRWLPVRSGFPGRPGPAPR